jgi:hypothetical protein
MPDVGGDRSGLVGQIADALGGLFDGMPDVPVAEDPPALDTLGEQDPDLPECDVAEPATESTEDTVPEEVPVDEPAVAAVERPEAGSTPPPEPPPELPPEPPPPSPAAEQPDEQTPCEIAADELAQVGQ